MNRFFKALFGMLIFYRYAIVMRAVVGLGPAVIFAGLRDIDLIATLGAMLMNPQFSGFRMNRGALHTAMTVRPDFRFGLRIIDEWIAVGH